jgi:hypothetical protein
MKKTLTLLLAFLLTGSLYAQRNIDWSIEELITPSNLYSDLQSGTQLPIKFVCKNNGPDALQPGDTILWFGVLIDIESNQAIVQMPGNAISQGARYVRVLSDPVNSGDTIHVGLNLRTQLILTASRNIRLGLGSTVRNGSNPITDGTAANNELIEDMIWFNPWENGVSVEDVEFKNNIAVYPNPANTQLKVKLLLTNFENSTVELFDMQGRVVLSENVASAVLDASYTVDVSEIPNGIYTVRVTNGDQVSTSKVSINH